MKIKCPKGQGFDTETCQCVAVDECAEVVECEDTHKWDVMTCECVEKKEKDGDRRPPKDDKKDEKKPSRGQGLRPRGESTEENSEEPSFRFHVGEEEDFSNRGTGLTPPEEESEVPSRRGNSGEEVDFSNRGKGLNPPKEESEVHHSSRFGRN